MEYTFIIGLLNLHKTIFKMIDFSEFCYDGSTKTNETSVKCFSESEKKEDYKKNENSNIKINKDTKLYCKTSKDVVSESSINLYSNISDSNISDSHVFNSPSIDSTIVDSSLSSVTNSETTMDESIKKKLQDPRHPMFRYTLPRGHNKNIIEEFMFEQPPSK